MLQITFHAFLKMTVSLHSFYLLVISLADVDFEYLKINIEDTTDVPIKLSFPVAWNFIENAFNECKLLSRDKSKRNNALVDDVISTNENIQK
jgi:hypothetical protein